MIQYLFSASFTHDATVLPLPKELTSLHRVLTQIDTRIQIAAPQFPIGKIAKIDAAVLRYAIFELFYIKDAPPKVIVDEAVEIAKEFGGQSSSSFVNGVLGTLVKQIS